MRGKVLMRLGSMGKQILHKSIINNERPVLMGRRFLVELRVDNAYVIVIWLVFLIFVDLKMVNNDVNNR